MSIKAVRKSRSKARLTSSRPLLIITRSNKSIMAQISDAKTKKTLATLLSRSIDGATKTQESESVGKLIADKCKELKIAELTVDRNGLVYHGRVRSLVESVRNNGIII
jgi:large subunit ribosomal protein L18